MNGLASSTPIFRSRPMTHPRLRTVWRDSITDHQRSSLPVISLQLFARGRVVHFEAGNVIAAIELRRLKRISLGCADCSRRDSPVQRYFTAKTSSTARCSAVSRSSILSWRVDKQRLRRLIFKVPAECATGHPLPASCLPTLGRVDA